MKLRAPFNYDVDQASLDSGLSIDPDEDQAKQSFKDECDINEIVRRFGLGEGLPENFRMPVSGDFTGVSDFKSAMDLVADAQSMFMELPGELRARFRNDPQELMAFLEDGKNRDEALELGLVQPAPEVTRDVVTAVDELAAKIVPPAKP